MVVYQFDTELLNMVGMKVALQSKNVGIKFGAEFSANSSTEKNKVIKMKLREINFYVICALHFFII